MAARTSQTKHHVVISGAGLAGLTTAAAFAQRGWRVSMYERSDVLREFGAGIWLWPNGLAALRHVGAGETFDEFNHLRVTGWRIRDVARNQELDMPVSPVCVAHRQYLYNSILERCRALGVEFTTGVTSDDADPDGTIRLSTGETSHASLVVAADGVHSRIARNGNFVKRRNESTAVGARMLVPRSVLPDLTICDENWNRSRTFLITPVDAEWTYLYLGTSIEDREAIRREAKGQGYELARDVWGESFAEYAHVLDHVPKSIRWDRFVVTTPQQWTLGRIVAVGDSINAITPALGQAGNLAMVNGATLGEIVASQVDAGGCIGDALAEWERAVAPQTDWTRKWCNGYSKISYLFPEALSLWRMPIISRVLSSQPIAKRLLKATTVVPSAIS